MNGFMISTQDAPGIAARLLEASAARGVNVFPSYGLSDGNTGSSSWFRTTRRTGGAIADAGLQATALEMVTTEIDNRPGTGAELFRKLADAVSMSARRCRWHGREPGRSWPSRPTTWRPCDRRSAGRRSGLRPFEPAEAVAVLVKLRGPGRAPRSR